jgi:hypothetical protein
LGIALCVVFAAVQRWDPSLRHAEGPPPGHTGGFGEPTCLACHNEFAINPAEAGTLDVDGLPDSYEAGATYRVSIVMTGDDEMRAAGFQGAFRYAAGERRGQRAGAVLALDETVTVVPVDSTNVEYVQHKRAGTRTVHDGLVTWTFEWTAPTSTDPVVFNVAANSANGDDSPLGDLVFTSEAHIGGGT